MTRGSRVRICDPDSVDLGPWRQGMGPRPHAAGVFAHRDPSDDQGVRDERPMAAPRNGLRTHQHHTRFARETNAPIQTLLERRGLHVVRIPAEARIPPPRVLRVSPWMAQSAQPWQVRVPHPNSTEGARQQVTTELRVVTRSRNSSDIDDAFDAVGLEQTDELGDRSC